eukprot:NODE_515_length_2646_cov_16.767737_g442_i0.p1 GENE.NODE_515_length_2646_cov_16.767737_g442_i0~~NODE_515_length_2646_cov_16.767737_g442_i0.p1  ORF type:complete len:464 (+),score=48.63 NODE_515_length_2646_cov_16.767737_g442_i0:974-2365(+)
MDYWSKWNVLTIDSTIRNKSISIYQCPSRKYCPGGFGERIYTCQPKRDINSPLCGQCQDNYFEFLGECYLNRNTNDSWKVILMLLFGSVYFLYLHKSSVISNGMSMIPSQLPGFLQMISIYYNALDLDNSWIYSFINVGSSAGSGFIMETFYLKLPVHLQLCMPSFTFLLLCWFMIQQMIIHRIIQRYTLKFGNMHLMDYFNTLMSVLILSYFSILIQLIKLFLCIPFDKNQYVNYFYPSIRCWSYNHHFPIIFNSVFVASMTSIFVIIIYKGHNLPNDHKLLPTLLKCQIPVVSTISKWWSFLFLFYRILYLSMFVAFTSFQSDKENGIVGMSCVCLLLLLILAWFKPFPIYHDNTVAVMLTFGLGISLVMGLVRLDVIQYIGILILAIIFVPTIMYTIYHLVKQHVISNINSVLSKIGVNEKNKTIEMSNINLEGELVPDVKSFTDTVDLFKPLLFSHSYD